MAIGLTTNADLLEFQLWMSVRLATPPVGTRLICSTNWTCEYFTISLLFLDSNEESSMFRQVDTEILNILKLRKYDCFDYYGPNQMWKCAEAIETFEENELNFFIKCKCSK